MRMDDCATDTTPDNQGKRLLPAAKSEIDGDEVIKGDRAPSLAMQTTPDKMWSPLSGTNDNSVYRESEPDVIDPVGSSASPQIAECDSAQGSGSQKSDVESTHLVLADDGSKAAIAPSNPRNASPETSICAVSSTVNDDEEKECMTVSSSFTGAKPVSESDKSFDSIKSHEEDRHSNVDQKGTTGINIVTKTMFGFPGSGSENKRRAEDEDVDGKTETKKAKVSESEKEEPESPVGIVVETSQDSIADSGSKKCKINETVTKLQTDNLKNDSSKDADNCTDTVAPDEVANHSKMNHSGSIITDKKESQPKDATKEKESGLGFDVKKDLCKVPVVSWSKSASQPSTQSVTSTISQDTTDTIHRGESPIRLKDTSSSLNADTRDTESDNEKKQNESVSSDQKIVPSSPSGAIRDCEQGQNKDRNNEKTCGPDKEPVSGEINPDVNQDHLPSSVKDCPKINTSTSGVNLAKEDEQVLSTSASSRSAANMISSSSSSSASSSSSSSSSPPPLATITSKDLSAAQPSDHVTSSCKTNPTKMVVKYTDGQFECQLCTFSSDQVGFEDHLFKHMENQALRCDDCSANIYSINAWHQHLQERHEGERVLPTNVCEIIDMVKSTGIQTYSLKPFVRLIVENNKASSSTAQILYPDPDIHIQRDGVSEQTTPAESSSSSSSSLNVPDFLEFTFVNKEFFCLKCAKKSEDKEIFRFHIWTHTHSPESTYCCCTTLTRESCEVVANIIQLISNMNQSVISDLTATKEKVIICRVRKVDLNLETVFKRPSDIKNLSVSTSLLADREIPVKQSPPVRLSDPQTVLKEKEKPAAKSFGSGDKVNETPKKASGLKETVIVENPLRAGTDCLSGSGSLGSKGCEKTANINPLVNRKSSDVKGSEVRASLKKSESEISLKSFEPEKKRFKAEPEFGRIKIKREPEEDLLLADINKKIMNIKKEVKEFASLTDMLCDMSTTSKIMSPMKTERNPTDQDEVLNLKVGSSLSRNADDQLKKTAPLSSSASSNSSSHFFLGGKGTDLSKTSKPGLENFSSSLRSFVNSEISTPRNVEPDNRGAFYKCGFNGCLFASMNSMEFRSHLENAHKYMTVYPCAHCGHTASGEDSLLRHMQGHTMSKVFLLYKCAFLGCRFGTNLLHEFREHNEILHQYETDFRCLNCSTVFYDLSDLIGHLKTNLLKFIQCPHCSVKDRNRQTVLAHISEAHPGKPKQIVVTSQVVCREKQEESLNNSSVPPESHPTRPYVQAKTPFLQKDEIEYLETKLSATDIPPALKLSLERHEMANNSTPNSRNKLLPFSKEQLEHFKEIADKYLHSCKLCTYSTSQSYLLEEHMKNYHPSFLGDFLIKHQVSDSPILPKTQQDMFYNFRLDPPTSPKPGFENKAVAKACCHLCPVAYKHVQQLKTHVRVKHPNCHRLDFYKCIHCNAKSTSKEYLIISCKKRHPNKEFRLTQVQEVLEPSKKKKPEVLDIIANQSQDGGATQPCEHGYLPPCLQCDANSPEKDIKHWKKHLFGGQGSDDSVTDYEKPFVCKVFKNMVKPTKVQQHSPILTVPSAKNAIPKVKSKSKKNSSEKKKSANAASNIDNSSDFLPPCEIGSQTLDSKLSVLYTRNRKWNRCKCCQFTTDHVATIHHHILDCHLKLYLWTCPYCDLKSIKKQNIIQHCLHFHETKKPGANFEDQSWNKHIRSILNLLPKDTSASTFTKQTFIISGPSSEAPNCYRLATEPLSIPASLTKPNRPTVVKLSNGVYKCSVCSTKGFVEWQVQRHIDTEHWSELKESGGKRTGNIVLSLENHQADINSGLTGSANNKEGSNSGRKSPPGSDAVSRTGLADQDETDEQDDIDQFTLSSASKDEEMKAMANKIIEVSRGILQCPFCSYRSRLRTCVKCHIWSQHMMLKRKRCKHCSFASWFDSGIEAHMATEHPRLCFSTETAKSGYTVLVEEPDGTWKETTVNFIHPPKMGALSRKRPSSKKGSSSSEVTRKKSKPASKSGSSKNVSTASKLSEFVESSSDVLNLSSKKSTTPTAISRPGVITSAKSSNASVNSAKTNKPVKPGLVISPKFFKMSKSGVINLTKMSSPEEASAATSASEQPTTTAASQNKLNLINVPKFKARDSSSSSRSGSFHVAEDKDDEEEEASEEEEEEGEEDDDDVNVARSKNENRNAQEKQRQNKNIFSRLLGRNEGGTTSGQPPKRQNTNANSNASQQKNPIEKALPDSLISIDTRMEEMCVREFNEKLMQHTFTCTICSYKTTNRTTFNSHTYSHKPPAFKCGYCPFRANPRCRVTAHIRKYHKEPMIKIINLSNLPKRAIDKNPSMTREQLTALYQQKNGKANISKSKKESVKPPATAGTSSSDSIGNVKDVAGAGRKGEFGDDAFGNDDLRLDNDLIDDMDDFGDDDEDLYSSLTFCCHSCSFRTKNIDRFTKHTSLHNFFTHGMKVACMDCSFSTNRILDYEDHISRHMDGFLFYCGCCSFSSLEEKEVREHSLKKHPDRVISIEISPGPPSLSTKWSPVDLDPSVELTDFLAMDCERFYNLISMYGVTMVDLKSTAVSYEDMNVKSGSDDSGTELDVAESPEEEEQEGIGEADEEATTTKDLAGQPVEDLVAVKGPAKSKKKAKGAKLTNTQKEADRSSFDDDDQFSSDDSVHDRKLNPMSDKEASGDEDVAGETNEEKDNLREDDGNDGDDGEEARLEGNDEEKSNLKNTDNETDNENDADIDEDDDNDGENEDEDDSVHDNDDDDDDDGKPSKEDGEDIFQKSSDLDTKENSETQNKSGDKNDGADDSEAEEDGAKNNTIIADGDEDDNDSKNIRSRDDESETVDSQSEVTKTNEDDEEGVILKMADCNDDIDEQEDMFETANNNKNIVQPLKEGDADDDFKKPKMDDPATPLKQPDENDIFNMTTDSSDELSKPVMEDVNKDVLTTMSSKSNHGDSKPSKEHDIFKMVDTDENIAKSSKEHDIFKMVDSDENIAMSAKEHDIFKMVDSDENIAMSAKEHDIFKIVDSDENIAKPSKEHDIFKLTTDSTDELSKSEMEDVNKVVLTTMSKSHEDSKDDDTEEDSFKMVAENDKHHLSSNEHVDKDVFKIAESNQDNIVKTSNEDDDDIFKMVDCNEDFGKPSKEDEDDIFKMAHNDEDIAKPSKEHDIFNMADSDNNITKPSKEHDIFNMVDSDNNIAKPSKEHDIFNMADSDNNIARPSKEHDIFNMVSSDDNIARPSKEHDIFNMVDSDDNIAKPSKEHDIFNMADSDNNIAKPSKEHDIFNMVDSDDNIAKPSKEHDIFNMVDSDNNIAKPSKEHDIFNMADSDNNIAKPSKEHDIFNMVDSDNNIAKPSKEHDIFNMVDSDNNIAKPSKEHDIFNMADSDNNITKPSKEHDIFNMADSDNNITKPSKEHDIFNMVDKDEDFGNPPKEDEGDNIAKPSKEHDILKMLDSEEDISQPSKEAEMDIFKMAADDEDITKSAKRDENIFKATDNNETKENFDDKDNIATDNILTTEKQVKNVNKNTELDDDDDDDDDDKTIRIREDCGEISNTQWIEAEIDFDSLLSDKEEKNDV